MRRRLITLIASLALLVGGAVPAMAAPGGIPGPPDGHGKKGNDAVVDDVDGEEDESKLPEWAKAHGKRIKDATGLTFGHLKQCADEDKVSERCDVYEGEFPDDMTGASAFAIWYFAENESLLLGL